MAETHENLVFFAVTKHVLGVNADCGSVASLSGTPFGRLGPFHHQELASFLSTADAARAHHSRERSSGERWAFRGTIRQSIEMSGNHHESSLLDATRFSSVNPTSFLCAVLHERLLEPKELWNMFGVEPDESRCFVAIIERLLVVTQLFTP